MSPPFAFAAATLTLGWTGAYRPPVPGPGWAQRTSSCQSVSGPSPNGKKPHSFLEPELIPSRFSGTKQYCSVTSHNSGWQHIGEHEEGWRRAKPQGGVIDVDHICCGCAQASFLFVGQTWATWWSRLLPKCLLLAVS